MMQSGDVSKDIRTLWNVRAKLGEEAGTRDVIAKQLEVEAICRYIADGMRVLDVGCGNGITAIELARRYRVDVTGIDFSEEMIAAATAMSTTEHLRGSVRFHVSDVRALPKELGKFDLAYTERALINLPDWPTQKQAIFDITNMLVEGGLYVMCENSWDGLGKINSLREMVGLHKIEPPWHNRYLRDNEIEEVKSSEVVLEAIVFYSSTYYLLSRVINAWVAAREGKEPDYDSAINRLALRLPPIGDLGQGRIWLWRKVAETSLHGAKSR